MKHTKEEIIKALNVIRDECNCINCMQCPFGDSEPKDGKRCKLQRSEPAKWVIHKEEEHWRALH
jgi:hypothetical protein